MSPLFKPYQWLSSHCIQSKAHSPYVVYKVLPASPLSHPARSLPTESGPFLGYSEFFPHLRAFALPVSPAQQSSLAPMLRAPAHLLKCHLPRDAFLTPSFENTLLPPYYWPQSVIILLGCFVYILAHSSFLKKKKGGFPIVVQRKRILISMMMQVRSLALLSQLRIQSCLELRCRPQM